MFNNEDRRLLHAIAGALNIDIQIGLAGLVNQGRIMADLSDITDAAEKSQETMDGAVIVINGIAARIDAAVAAAGSLTPEDKQKLADLATGLRGRAAALAFAIDADQPPATDGGAPVVDTTVPN